MTPAISGGTGSSALRFMGLIVMVLAMVATANGEERERYRRLVQRPYAEVVRDVEFAIHEANFRVTDRNRIGQAIAERHDIPFPNAEVIHFCNLEYARRLLGISWHYLLYMPCRVAIHERLQAGQPQTVVEALLIPVAPASAPPTQALIGEINAILKQIVDYPAQW